MKVIDGRGILLAIADDVKICAPPEVIAEIVAKLPELAMSEAGLTTHATKNMVYVQPPALARWTTYLNNNPRNAEGTLSLHDIRDGRIPIEIDPYDPDLCLEPVWPANDGINILGTPLGSPKFVKQHLTTKLEKHKTLLAFIADVV
jgi:hypothetical protein